MLRSSLFSAALAAALLFSGRAASADTVTTYDLSGVTLSAADKLTGSGGTLTGFFTVDYTTAKLTNWSLTASAFGSFSQFTYSPANSTGIDGIAAMYIQSDDPTNSYELRLYFPQGTANPLPNNTPILTGGFSYDSQPTPGYGQNRFVTAGSVVIDNSGPVGSAVPLPPAVWMAAPLLAIMGLLKVVKKAALARA